jgi:hypothetical protein
VTEVWYLALAGPRNAEVMNILGKKSVSIPNRDGKNGPLRDVISIARPMASRYLPPPLEEWISRRRFVQKCSEAARITRCRKYETRVEMMKDWMADPVNIRREWKLDALATNVESRECYVD